VLSIFAVILLFNFNITSKYEFHNNIISANLNLKKEYYITYNLDGGTHSNPIKYNINSVPFTLKAPSKAGYTFLGWTGSNGNTPQTEITIDKDANLQNLSYTANWTANTYTIKFNGNGSTDGTTANETMTYNAAKNLTANGFTRTGYTFKCWNTKADGTGTSYINSQSVKNLATSGTFNLYAIWNINSYKLTLNKGAGISSVSGAGTYKYGSSVTVKATLPTNNTDSYWSGQTTTKEANIRYKYSHKYSFKNWTGIYSSTNAQYTFTMPANNITLTANGNDIKTQVNTQICQPRTNVPGAIYVDWTVGTSFNTANKRGFFKFNNETGNENKTIGDTRC